MATSLSKFASLCAIVIFLTVAEGKKKRCKARYGPGTKLKFARCQQVDLGGAYRVKLYWTATNDTITTLVKTKTSPGDYFAFGWGWAGMIGSVVHVAYYVDDVIKFAPYRLNGRSSGFVVPEGLEENGWGKKGVINMMFNHSTQDEGRNLKPGEKTLFIWSTGATATDTSLPTLSYHGENKGVQLVTL